MFLISTEIILNILTFSQRIALMRFSKTHLSLRSQLKGRLWYRLKKIKLKLGVFVRYTAKIESDGISISCFEQLIIDSKFLLL